MSNLIEAEPILTMDVKNKNGRLYSTEVVEQTLPKFQHREIAGMIGMPRIMPSDEDPVARLTVPAERMSHAASNFRIINGQLCADIRFLKTKAGRDLQALHEKDGVDFRMAGLVEQDSDGRVTYFTFFSVNALPKGQGA